jgi:hypothetical protein
LCVTTKENIVVKGKNSTVKNPTNTFRFMPCRAQAKGAEGEVKILLNGIRYARNAVPNSEKGFVVGAAIGPGQDLNLPKGAKEGPDYRLSAGGIIVPIQPNEKFEGVPIRDFKVPGDKKGRTKQFIDWATFKKEGNNLFRVVPCIEDRVMYVEVWTGNIEQSELAYQLIQANMFDHGSVAYAGGTVVINALSDEKGQKPDQHESSVRASKAEMLSESSGLVVAGIPLWTARLWRINYSAKDSEALLVQQLGRYFIVLAEGGTLVHHEMPATAYKRKFEQLLGEDLVKKVAA